MADWAALPLDLLAEIAKKFHLFEDYVLFGVVCTTWRAAGRKENFNGPSPQIPWLMLSEDKEKPEFRDFYSLSKNEVIRKKAFLPEAAGKLCIESQGWLITVAEDGAMSLLHPLTRVQIQLPHDDDSVNVCVELPTPFLLIRAASLSASPSETSDYAVVIVHYAMPGLAYWKPGHESWSRIETEHGALSDVLSCNGIFYAIKYSGRVMKFDTRGPDPIVAQEITQVRYLICGLRFYLVESSSPNKLFVVGRDGNNIYEDNRDYGVTEFKVFEVDLIKASWVETKNIGDRAIFVGHNDSFSLKASSFPRIIKPNHIYFTDDNYEAYYYKGYEAYYDDNYEAYDMGVHDGGKDIYFTDDNCEAYYDKGFNYEAYYDKGFDSLIHDGGKDMRIGGGKDMGIYNVEDGSFESHFKGESFSRICPPVWVTPTFE